MVPLKDPQIIHRRSMKIERHPKGYWKIPFIQGHPRYQKAYQWCRKLNKPFDQWDEETKKLAFPEGTDFEEVNNKKLPKATPEERGKLPEDYLVKAKILLGHPIKSVGQEPNEELRETKEPEKPQKSLAALPREGDKTKTISLADALRMMGGLPLMGERRARRRTNDDFGIPFKSTTREYQRAWTLCTRYNKQYNEIEHLMDIDLRHPIPRTMKKVVRSPTTLIPPPEFRLHLIDKTTSIPRLPEPPKTPLLSPGPEYLPIIGATTLARCPYCHHTQFVRHGWNDFDVQRYGCKRCKRKFILDHSNSGKKLYLELMVEIFGYDDKGYSGRKISVLLKEKYGLQISQPAISRALKTWRKAPEIIHL
jgi:hypothetical protein